MGDPDDLRLGETHLPDTAIWPWMPPGSRFPILKAVVRGNGGRCPLPNGIHGVLNSRGLRGRKSSTIRTICVSARRIYPILSSGPGWHRPSIPYPQRRSKRQRVDAFCQKAWAIRTICVSARRIYPITWPLSEALLPLRHARTPPGAVAPVNPKGVLDLSPGFLNPGSKS